MPSASAARQCLGIVLFVVGVAIALPRASDAHREFTLTPDNRMPRESSEDYWFMNATAGLAAEEHDALVLAIRSSGASSSIGTRRCPTTSTSKRVSSPSPTSGSTAPSLALEGLVEHYAGGIAGKKVLLQCNPLWLSSLKTDLQHPDAEVNHARLVPQFVPRIPAYKDEISPRLGVLVNGSWPSTSGRTICSKRTTGLTGRTTSPAGRWTPYANPLAPLQSPLPVPDDKAREDSGPWKKRGVMEQDYDWIDMDKSLQWPAFQRVADLAAARQPGVRRRRPLQRTHADAREPGSLREGQEHDRGLLKANDIAHAVPPALASEQYADASHPIAAGYEVMAEELWDAAFFR